MTDNQDPRQELLTELRSGTINFDDEALAAIDRYADQRVAEAYTIERHLYAIMPEAFKGDKWHIVSFHFKWNPDSKIDLGAVSEIAIQSPTATEGDK